MEDKGVTTEQRATLSHKFYRLMGGFTIRVPAVRCQPYLVGGCADSAICQNAIEAVDIMSYLVVQ